MRASPRISVLMGESALAPPPNRPGNSLGCDRLDALGSWEFSAVTTLMRVCGIDTKVTKRQDTEII